MESTPHLKRKRIGRRRNPGIETMTARETEVACLPPFLGSISVDPASLSFPVTRTFIVILINWTTWFVSCAPRGFDPLRLGLGRSLRKDTPLVVQLLCQSVWFLFYCENW